jgi:hypothetical protein
MSNSFLRGTPGSLLFVYTLRVQILVNQYSTKEFRYDKQKKLNCH